MSVNGRPLGHHNQSQMHNRQRSQDYRSSQTKENEIHQSPVDDSTSRILQTLLGSSITSWPYEETTLVHALALRTEQEKTKQDYYKTESLNRTLELMKYAVNIGIPAQSIPLLFANGNSSSDNNGTQELIRSLSVPTNNNNNAVNNNTIVATPQGKEDPFKSNENMPSQQIQSRNQPSLSQPYLPRHERSMTVSTPNDLRSIIPNNNNPMSSFKFGGGPPVSSPTTSSPFSRLPRLEHNTNILRKTTLTPKQQLSPAKMGAQAVATLAADRSSGRFPSTSYNPYHQQHHHSSPSPGLHQRHSSLPPKVSIPESEALDFSSASKRRQQVPPVPSPMGSQQMHQMSNIIQAKRQPPSSHMRSASSQLTSQESMIQQHHFIQFHHWKPTSGDSPTNPSHSASSSASSFISSASSNSTSITAENDSISSPAKRRRSSASVDDTAADTSTESIRSELPIELSTPKRLPRPLNSSGMDFTTPTQHSKEMETTISNNDDDNNNNDNNNTLTSTASTPLKSPLHTRTRSDHNRFPNNILS